MRYDVAIVGGGPAGSLTAMNLEGERVVLLEEHQSPGFPAQCAGLISLDCLKLLSRYVDAEKFTINEIDGAYFFSPSGECVRLKGKSRAAVVERKVMDCELLKACNADVLVKSKVTGVEAEGNGFLVRSVRGDVRADCVVGADGPGSVVARDLGFDRPKMLSAAQVECRMETDEKFVEIYFGYSDFMFGYAVPTGEEFARVGVVSESNAINWLRKLIEEHPSVSKRVDRSKLDEINCGAIPFGIVDFVRGNAVLIGDSAGMVKPYTGGGIYYLTIAAEMLGKHFPDFEAFRDEYMKRLGKEYAAGMRIARLYRELNRADYDYLIELGRGNERLAEELHMDRPSTLVRVLPVLLRLVKRPRLALKIARCLL